MALNLCQIKTAKNPYYIVNIGRNIYSIEELCFYLYENMYLLDETIINEALCIWLRDELGLKRLYSSMIAHLEKKDGIVNFITPVFREINYLEPQKMREYQDRVRALENLNVDVRQKLKGDYLIKCGMFENAILEYYQVLHREAPGQAGTEFYSQVWNNLGCAYARMFQFRDAGRCFRKIWEMSGTRDSLRKYVSILPLYLSDEEYSEELKKLGADQFLISKIQEYNARIAEESSGENPAKEWTDGRLADELELLKSEYRRGAGL